MRAGPGLEPSDSSGVLACAWWPVPDTVHLCCHDVVDALIAVWLLTLLLAQTRYSTGLVAMLLPLSPVLTGGVLCGVVLVPPPPSPYLFRPDCDQLKQPRVDLVAQEATVPSGMPTSLIRMLVQVSSGWYFQTGFWLLCLGNSR